MENFFFYGNSTGDPKILQFHSSHFYLFIFNMYIRIYSLIILPCIPYNLRQDHNYMCLTHYGNVQSCYVPIYGMSKLEK